MPFILAEFFRNLLIAPLSSKEYPVYAIPAMLSQHVFDCQRDSILIFIFAFSSISVVPRVRPSIPFSVGVTTPAFAAEQKVVGPVHGTIYHSVGRMYSTETAPRTLSLLLMPSPLLKSSTWN